MAKICSGGQVPEPEARQGMISRLRPLAEQDTRGLLNGDQPPFISAFVTRDRETISELAMPRPDWLSCSKVARRCCAERTSASSRSATLSFCRLARGLTSSTSRDRNSGVYRALFVRFARELVIEAARLWPQLVGTQASHHRSVVLGPALCSAIVHSGEAVSGRLGASRRVVDHRILEILLLLAEQDALPLIPKYVEVSIVEAVRLLVRHRLDHPWSNRSVAAELSMSEATLRRRMRQEGQTLQALLLAERMQAAYLILSDRDAEVADAIAATGYTSRLENSTEA